MSNQDRDFTVGTETSYGIGKPEKGYPKTPPLTEELVRQDVDDAILHRHEWRPQKWEYKIEHIHMFDYDEEDRLNRLGEEGWKLLKQTDEKHNITLLTFMRPKVEDKS